MDSLPQNSYWGQKLGICHYQSDPSLHFPISKQVQSVIQAQRAETNSAWRVECPRVLSPGPSPLAAIPAAPNDLPFPPGPPLQGLPRWVRAGRGYNRGEYTGTAQITINLNGTRSSRADRPFDIYGERQENYSVLKLSGLSVTRYRRFFPPEHLVLFVLSAI